MKDSKEKAEKALGYPQVESSFEEPPEGHGDVCFNTFQYSKVVKKRPETIAEELSKAMEPSTHVSTHKSVGAYVNSYINMDNFSKLALDTILDLGDRFGASPDKGVKVILEHTSVNPTGPIHVGRARNPILGDTLARVMRKAGYDVTSEFYVNDVGKQVVMLAWGVLNELPDGPEEAKKDGDRGKEKDDNLLVGFYRKAYELYEKDESVKDEIDKMLQRFESGDEELGKKIESIVERMLGGMVSSLKTINVNLDNFVRESGFLRNRKVNDVVERLKGLDLCKEDGNAYYLDIKSYVPGHKGYYITRSDGTTLYTARDMAYHLDKFERCDIAVNVLGEDQKLGMAALKVGLKLLGAKKAPENVFYSFVSLPEGKMSTRKGVVVSLDDLVDEALERAFAEVTKRREDLDEDERQNIARVVGIGAIRYNIGKVQAEKPIVFRWSEALNFEGNSAPFIQYAHARCHGILSKAGGYGEHEPSELNQPQEVALIKFLAKFPAVVEECAETRKVHPISTYAYNLASMFNIFYRDCPVLTAEGSLKNSRLALVESSKTVLRNSLECMGIEAPDSM
ncbi:MAG: arginine--tRNA ligase [Thermoplasmata archaeon]|nr:arginine--tRNA ligase [Thermoplasmata archaeon]